MLGQVDSIVAPLRQVLEDGEWHALRKAIAKLPKKISKKNPAFDIETIRVAADVLIEECAVSTAFERAYIARQALHECDIANWVVPCLQAVNPASVVARRLVALVESLATTEIGRSKLGKAKCVDALVAVWRAAPRGAGVPATLCALCSGHIDNISRVMRSGGVAVAAKAVRAAMADENSGVEGRRTIECSLLLLGLLCICVPDLRTGATELVPLVREVIQYAANNNERITMAHAINVIGNVAECWRKEGRGFVVADPHGLADDILQAWNKEPRDRRVVGAAAWALTGLIRTKNIHATDASGFFDTVPLQLEQVLARASKSAGAVRALRKLADEIRVEAVKKVQAEAFRKAQAEAAKKARKAPSTPKKSRKRKIPSEEDSDDDVVIVETHIKRARTNADVPCTPRRSTMDKEIPETIEQTPTRIGSVTFDEIPVAAFVNANNSKSTRRLPSRSPTRIR